MSRQRKGAGTAIPDLLQSFLETIMSKNSNQTRNSLPDEDEHEDPVREPEQDPQEGGGHVPNTSTEPRIKNN